MEFLPKWWTTLVSHFRLQAIRETLQKPTREQWRAKLHGGVRMCWQASTGSPEFCFGWSGPLTGQLQQLFCSPAPPNSHMVSCKPDIPFILRGMLAWCGSLQTKIPEHLPKVDGTWCILEPQAGVVLITLRVDPLAVNSRT